MIYLVHELLVYTETDFFILKRKDMYMDRNYLLEKCCVAGLFTMCLFIVNLCFEFLFLLDSKPLLLKIKWHFVSISKSREHWRNSQSCCCMTRNQISCNCKVMLITIYLQCVSPTRLLTCQGRGFITPVCHCKFIQISDH